MPVRLSIPKLAAAGIAPLQTPPRFTSELLRSGVTWPQDVNYLRDTYMEVYGVWERLAVLDDDQRLYSESMPKIREVVLGLEDVMRQVTNRLDMFRMVQNAQHDFTIAEFYGRAGDFAMATVYQSYSLMKLHRVLDGLTLQANRKRAYGYDVSGEVMEPGEQESRSPNLWDQGNSPKLDHTPSNPANSLVDPDAENEFPELKETKHKRVEWPARSR